MGLNMKLLRPGNLSMNPLVISWATSLENPKNPCPWY